MPAATARPSCRWRVVVLAGLASFLGLSFRVDFLAFVVILPLERLWLLALGMLMWRRTRVIGS